MTVGNDVSFLRCKHSRMPTIMLAADQKLFIIRRYYETKSIVTVIRELATKFNLQPKDTPSRFVVLRLIRKFESTLCLKRKPRRSGMPYRTGKNEKIQVLKEKIKNDPAISIRRCRAETGFSYSIIQRYLKSELKLRSYKLQLLQEIKPADYEKRVPKIRLKN